MFGIISFIIILLVIPSVVLTLALCKAASKNRRYEECDEQIYEIRTVPIITHEYRLVKKANLRMTNY